MENRKNILKPMKIGGVCIETPLFLAPMAGVTDRAFRRICREHGCGFATTEMVSAKAILYNNKNTYELLNLEPGEHPVAVQLFGSDPQILADMAARVEKLPVDVIDFNMGCPVPKIVGNGEGSALMKDIPRVKEIIGAMSAAVKKPVTVKIRKGFDEDHANAVEVALAAQEAGAAAVCVHGRTRSQFYSGKADWDIIRQVKEALDIPVIGNGDISSPEDAARMLEATGCDGIMVGRAARGNPWIFEDILLHLSGLAETPRTRADIYRMLLYQARLTMENKGEAVAMREMRKHIAWYTAGLAHSAQIRRQANFVERYEQMVEMFGDGRYE